MIKESDSDLPLVSAAYIQGKLNELTALAGEERDDDGDGGSDSNESNGPDTAQDQVPSESLFGAGDSSEALKILCDLLGERSIADMSQPVVKLAELLELGK